MEEVKHSLLDMIKRHEGFSAKPYRDTLGNWTIGWGHLITEGEERLLREEVPLEVLQGILLIDIQKAYDSLLKYSWTKELDTPRLFALIDMMFNLGPTKFRMFQKFIAALIVKDYDTAAKEMLDSLWAKQVKTRATELALIMRTGEL